MKKLMIVTLAIVALLVGCAKSETKDETPKMLDVNLTVNPEKGKPGENIHFEANVMYGKEKVNDVDEVIFEIWRSQSDKHEKIKASHGENGIYKISKTFSEEGTYYVYSHVTAKRTHVMPKKEFVVGKPSAPEQNGSSNLMGNGMHEKNSSDKMEHHE
jgi:hypothetical protein